MDEDDELRKEIEEEEEPQAEPEQPKRKLFAVGRDNAFKTKVHDEL